LTARLNPIPGSCSRARRARCNATYLADFDQPQRTPPRTAAMLHWRQAALRRRRSTGPCNTHAQSTTCMVPMFVSHAHRAPRVTRDVLGIHLLQRTKKRTTKKKTNNAPSATTGVCVWCLARVCVRPWSVRWRSCSCCARDTAQSSKISIRQHLIGGESMHLQVLASYGDNPSHHDIWDEPGYVDQPPASYGTWVIGDHGKPCPL
jgi:hypothetical protein